MSSTSIQEIVSDLLNQRTYVQAQTVDSYTAAVITVEEDLRYFATTLRAVLNQTVLPSVIVIADCTGQISQPVQAQITLNPEGQGDTQSVSVQLVRAKGARSFYDAVTKSLQYAHLNSSVRSLWTLHDDSRPANNACLEALIEARSYASGTSLFGAKQLDWEGKTLHNVGSYLGKHRLESLVVEGEPDQEQYDGRRDVFAVSFAGALVSLSAVRQLQGVNSWFGTYGEAADFSRRVCLSGGRVVVVPQAQIAHRRARFEGIRSHDGKPLDEQTPENTAMARLVSNRRYFYTDISAALWPLFWLLSIPQSILLAISNLFGKRPYEAWCELCQPWQALAYLGSGLHARRRVKQQSKVALNKLSVLIADRHQLAQWKDRQNALENQRHTVLLSSLAKAHLRNRVMKRWSAALLMAAACFAVIAVLFRNVLTSVWSGGSLYSAQLLASDVSFAQLARSATTAWVFGFSTGVPAPPTPWALVWLAASLLTFGHTAAATSLIFLVAAPLSALSFWALAGVFTRSDGVRLVAGLMWFSFGLCTGIYQSANLAMLTVMIFLPAAFAFVFRAVGMYHTEEPVRPHSSVQAAACAALCFIPVVASEPQLVFALLLIFVVFILLVRSHRMMLVLIPLPSALVLAPSLLNAIRYAHESAYRQLFADITIPSSVAQGAPASLSLADVVERAFGLDLRGGLLSGSSDVLQFCVLLAVIFIVVLAVVALLLPFALRASRMMWVVVVAGALLSMVSARIVISVDVEGAVAASVLPGMSLVMLGVLACVCLVSGGAVKHYAPLHFNPANVQLEGSAGAKTASQAQALSIRVARVALVTALAASSCVWLVFGLSQHNAQQVAISQSGLPMVASDYLNAGDGHRILALRAQTATRVDFSVMRTGKGDLADASAAQRAQFASGIRNGDLESLAAASARLLANPDSNAINEVSKLGFGGIYVRNDTTDKASSEASQKLISNINATEGVQSVVSADSGVYYRLTLIDMKAQSVNMSWQHSTEHSVWRTLWLWSMGIVTSMYCLVAVPRVRKFGREEL